MKLVGGPLDGKEIPAPNTRKISLLSLHEPEHDCLAFHTQADEYTVAEGSQEAHWYRSFTSLCPPWED